MKSIQDVRMAAKVARCHKQMAALTDEDLKSSRVTIRLTNASLKVLQDRADKIGIPVAHLIRNTLEAKTVDPEFDTKHDQLISCLQVIDQSIESLKQIMSASLWGTTVLMTIDEADKGQTLRNKEGWLRDRTLEIMKTYLETGGYIVKGTLPKHVPSEKFVQKNRSETNVL